MWIVGGALAVSVIVFAAPTALLLMAGLCPALASTVADNGPGKRRSHAIGAMNLAGLTPWLIKLWSQGGTFEAVRPILADPFTWLCTYGAAAGALALLWSGPWAATGILILSRRRMAARLGHEQRALEKEWGQEVVDVTPPAH
jgi:hypothetical protein